MRLLLSLLLLALAGCDTGTEPQDNPGDTPGADDLTGTWDFDAGRDVPYLTASQAQSARDPFRPGDGGVTVTGAETGSFRYFLGPTAAPETGALVREGTGLVDGANRYIGFNGTEPTQVSLRITSEGRQQTFRHELPPADDGYTLTDTYLEVAPVELVDVFTSELVTVSGRLTFARASVPAGRETALTPVTYGAEGVTVRRVTFGPSGAYSQVDEDRGGPFTRTGTWTGLDGGRVRVVMGDYDRTYRYVRDGSALTLSEDLYACTTNCDNQGQRDYGLLPGTTVSLRTEQSRTFRSVPTGGRP